MQPVLDVQGLTMDFGGLRALDGISMQVAKGEIVALIGPNGAGKTTFFNCITGIYEPTGGDMNINPPKGKPCRLNRLKPNVVTERGLARTFQNIRLFGKMTVLENVMVARHCRTHAGILGAITRNPRTRAEEREIVERSYLVLEKVGLERYVNELAQELPYGAQRRLEIARALATEPFLLLLDEPAAGMNPRETAELDGLITRIRDEEGISILLIEHDMKLVMSISDRIYVLDYGRMIAQGTPREVAANTNVIKAYLGETFDA
ncbi:MAG TPA: ABC transporter ATP-binding protein [Deltaproteobacteria bacterium]|jgi:branched-chain amino acid transport system ATP-binding protein|nr:ABC transporter ATP-binding protein [Deltaproteobacteria bacterium]HOI08201.1 ABC transporter ATP-binding protein [Deltaproteobacteria bacterium]